MIEEIKGLKAKLQSIPLVEVEVLVNRRVDVVCARATEGVALGHAVREWPHFRAA